MADRKIQGFKKFSDLRNVKDGEMEEVQPGIQPDTDSSRPMNPNLPNTGTKTPRMQSRKIWVAYNYGKRCNWNTKF